MNIFLLIVILSFADTPILPAKPRADRRAARNKAINHNRATYNNVLGPGKWYDIPDENGFYRLGPSWKPSIKTRKSQRGRWATDRLSGHRRYAKWAKESYASKADMISETRFTEALKDYYSD